MAKKIAYYRKKADKLFQQWFISKNSQCELCLNVATCGHHFVTKAASSALRYEEKNMIPVCTGCHLGFHSSRASDFIGRIVLLRGAKWFQYLQLSKYKISKINIGYYKDIIGFFESKLNK